MLQWINVGWPGSAQGIRGSCFEVPDGRRSAPYCKADFPTSARSKMFDRRVVVLVFADYIRSPEFNSLSWVLCSIIVSLTRVLPTDPFQPPQALEERARSSPRLSKDHQAQSNTAEDGRSQPQPGATLPALPMSQKLLRIDRWRYVTIADWKRSRKLEAEG